jgi:hypothetical protein
MTADAPLGLLVPRVMYAFLRGDPLSRLTRINVGQS